MPGTSTWLAKSVIQPFPYAMAPMNNITPLTMRDGITFLGTLERLRDWIENGIVPGFESIMQLAFQDFLSGIENAEQTVIESKNDWQTLFDAFVQNFQDEIKSLNDEAIAQLLNDADSATYKAVLLYVNSAVAALDASIGNEVDGKIEDFTEIFNQNIAAQALILENKIDKTQKASPNGVATLDETGKVPTSQIKVNTQRGFYKNRPAANTVTEGFIYNAYDVMESYRSNGVNWELWSGGGQELFFVGHDKSVDMFSTESTSYVDVPGLKMVATAGERPISISFDFVTAVNVMDSATYAIFVGGYELREFIARIEKTETWESVSGEATARDLTPGVSYDVVIKVKAINGTVRTSGSPYIKAVSV